MALSATIPALTAQDINHLRMSAYNLAALATDHGYAQLAAKLADVPENDTVELIRYINEIWDAVAIPLLQKARTQLDGFTHA